MEESRQRGPALGGAGASPAEATEMLDAVFESTAAGLAVLSGPDLRFERVNPAFRALTPRPEQDPTGLRFEEVWPGDDPAVLPALGRALESGEPWHSEEHTVSKAGAPRRFSLHVKRVEWRGRANLLVALWETTALWEAKRVAEEAAQNALRRASELDAMVDALPEGFVLHGPRGEILRMNATAERLLAPGPEERSLPAAARWGRRSVWNVQGRAIAFAESPVARALAGETVRSAHLKLETPSGTAWVLANAAPILAPGGSVWGAVCTLADESEVHALEEARDDLVRMISHDLRTPLNAVVAQAHVLRRNPLDPAKVEERARAIARSCDRMNAMIQDLLEATLLEAGQLRLSPRGVALVPFVRDVIERQRGALAIERVEVVERGPPPLVSADPDRIERVLVNLLSNALKYSPVEAAVTVEIGAAEGGGAVTVIDRGVGIAPEDLPHLFERFFRARGTRRPEGLGLGLYIARLLVQAHGGRVDVESRLGGGSAFRLVLPAERSPDGVGGLP